MKFNACAQNYDALAAPQHFFAGHVAKFIAADAPEIFSAPSSAGTRVGCDAVPILELGAGTGALTRHLVAICAASRAGSRAAIHATDAAPEIGRAHV